jgi:hypothetical protein
MEGITKELAQELLSILQGTRGFVVEEVPDVVHQILTFKFYENLIYGLIWSTIMVACLFLARKFWKHAKIGGEDAEWCLGGSISSCIVAAIILPAHMHYYINVIKISVAPKLYVLEFLLSIVSRG